MEATAAKLELTDLTKRYGSNIALAGYSVYLEGIQTRVQQQSLTSFQTCTLRITVGSWLLRYFLVKFAAGLLIGLLLWCLLGSIANIQFSVSVLGVVLVAE